MTDTTDETVNYPQISDARNLGKRYRLPCQ